MALTAGVLVIPGRRAITANILLNILARGGNVLCIFLSLRWGLSYLGSAGYGLWLTLSSVLSWVSFLDLGLSNGLRNRLTAALTGGDERAAAGYLAAAYRLLAVTALSVFAVLCLGLLLLVRLLPGHPLSSEGMPALLLAMGALQLLRFLLEPFMVLLTAMHDTGKAAMLATLGNLASLAAVFAVANGLPSGIAPLAWASTLPQVLVTAIATWRGYRTTYRHVRPDFSDRDRRRAGELLTLGGGFFLLQLAGWVIFSTDNLIILQLFSAEEVVPYNAAWRYYSLPVIFFSLVLAPFGPAFTALSEQMDTHRSRGMLRKLLAAWLALAACAWLLHLLAPYAYRLWLAEPPEVPASLNNAMLLFVILTTWNSLFASFLNARSRLRLQVTVAAATAVANLPLSVLLSRTAGLGPTGVMLATCLCLSAGSILAPIQCGRLLSGKAKGIWAA